MEVVISDLTKEQIIGVVDARRELSIIAVSKAAHVAGDLFLRNREAHSLLNQTTNQATKACRETEVNDSHRIITFQVTACEYVTAEAVKDQLTPVDYDILTFAFRAVLEPDSVPAALQPHLARLGRPAAAAHKPSVAPNGAKRSPAPKAASKAPVAPVKAKQPTAAEIAAFAKEMQTPATKKKAKK